MKKQKQHTIIRVLLLSNYLNIFGFSLFGPLYSLYVLRLGLSTVQIATALALYALTLGSLTIVAGRVENSMRRVTLGVILGYFVLMLGGAGYLWMHTLTQVYLVQALNALGGGIIGPAWKALYSRFARRGKEAQEWSYFDGGNQMLSAAAVLIGGFIITAWGFRFLFVVMIGLQLAGASISLYLLRFFPLGRTGLRKG